eukprot:g3737.t1
MGDAGNSGSRTTWLVRKLMSLVSESFELRDSFFRHNVFYIAQKIFSLSGSLDSILEGKLRQLEDDKFQGAANEEGEVANECENNEQCKANPPTKGKQKNMEESEAGNEKSVAGDEAAVVENISIQRNQPSSSRIPMSARVFMETGSVRPALDMERDRQKVREYLSQLVPEAVQSLVGGKNKGHQACMKIADFLQCQILVKNLTYTVLDLILQEVFPDVDVHTDYGEI